jgi:purine-binding chemotaxis protein CheW
VANLRGRILAVVELRARLGLAPAELSPRSRVVVVEVRGRVLGLLVDAVSQVTKVPQASVVPPPDEVRSAEADYVTGVARWQSRLIILLDLEKALAPTE